MTEVDPQELIIENNQQNKENVDTENVDKENKTKKIIIWGILIVLIVIVVYLLFGDKIEKYRLNTETRDNLFNTNKNKLPYTSKNNFNLNDDNFGSSTSSMQVGTISNLSSTSSMNTDLVSSSNTNQVRRELANLFKSYA